MSAHASNGANSHLCGSTMSESAQLDSGEVGPHALDEHRGESVGAVDVEPDVARLGRGGDRGDVVDDPEVRGAAGRHDGEDRAGMLVQCTLDRRPAESPIVVGSRADDVDVHHGRGGLDR